MLTILARISRNVCSHKCVQNSLEAWPSGALHTYIFIMVTIFIADRIGRTVKKTCFCSRAAYIIKPDGCTSSTKRIWASGKNHSSGCSKREKLKGVHPLIERFQNKSMIMKGSRKEGQKNVFLFSRENVVPLCAQKNFRVSNVTEVQLAWSLLLICAKYFHAQSGAMFLTKKIFFPTLLYRSPSIKTIQQNYV